MVAADLALAEEHPTVGLQPSACAMLVAPPSTASEGNQHQYEEVFHPATLPDSEIIEVPRSSSRNPPKAGRWIGVAADHSPHGTTSGARGHRVSVSFPGSVCFPGRQVGRRQDQLLARAPARMPDKLRSLLRAVHRRRRAVLPRRAGSAPCSSTQPRSHRAVPRARDRRRRGCQAARASPRARTTRRTTTRRARGGTIPTLAWPTPPSAPRRSSTSTRPASTASGA